jgi:RNA polymerase sigma factor (TIGR02999 family)
LNEDTQQTHDVTQLLVAWRQGSNQALEELVPMVYRELQRLARRQLSRERPGHTLQSTALVHEAFMRLINQRVDWKNRAHFFGVAAEQVRRILVDYARARKAAKRGGGAYQLELDEAAKLVEEREIDLVALDDALMDLGRVDPQQARIVELRFFAGLTIEETAEALSISPATVKRDWVVAQAYLKRALRRYDRS